MLRFLVRLTGLFLIAAGFVGLVVDGTRAIVNGEWSFVPLGQVAHWVFRERFLLVEPALTRHVHPWLWDPLLINVLLLPAGVVALVLGVLLLWLGQKREEPIGYLARR
ncbi:MAG TPA: hypothetical protein VM434_02535 [Beijerinckiaceae bacterium]|nr:hypothetical protein [Beijerinckiaceae bacterium]